MSAPYQLRIDRLRVPGLEPHEHDAMHRALERELGRLSTRHGLPRRVAQGPAWTPGGVVEVPSGASPSEIGVHMARFIHSSLGGFIPHEEQRP
ncbi:MAG: hypothetical protein AAF799_20680 [Myxococcota bacterium]